MNPARATAILLLTMLASFAVTYGFGVLWQGRPAEPPPIVRERAAIETQIAPSPIRAEPPAIVPKRPAIETQIAPRPIGSVPLAAQLPPAARNAANAGAYPLSASGSSTPVEADLAALPVQIRFRHISNIIQATVVNVSDAELTVDATVLNPVSQQTSLTTLNLAPRIPTVFGVRDGLELHPADQVTLRGASYGELVTTVR